MADFSVLYNDIENAKSSDGVQWTGRCAFHDDHANSFSWNLENGCCYCFAGCIQGGAYDYAVKIGMAEVDARKYFVNNSNEVYTSPKPKKILSPPPPKIIVNMDTLQKNVDRFIIRRLNNPHLVPKIWTEKVLGKLGVGLDDNDNLVFPYYDSEGNLLGYKVHKIEVKGGVKNHWYPAHVIGLYSHDKPLYIVEGEKDVITLLSRGLQAISLTAGASSNPTKNTIDILQYWNAEIVLNYDHDVAGYKGQRKVGEFIKRELPSHKVILGKWRDDLKKAYDTTDAFLHSSTGENFFEAVDNGEELEKQPINEEQYEGYETMSLDKFVEAEGDDFEPQYPLIDNIMDKGTISVIAGDEGTGKSWAILSACLSLASGVPLFDYFEIHSSEVDDSE